MLSWLFGRRPPEAEAPVRIPSSLASQEWLPVLSGARLYKLLGLDGRLEQIRTLTAFPPETFDLVCRPALMEAAERIQLCPASEAHHHSQPGGMLVHTLEAIEIALRLRKGYILPQGAKAEDILKLEHLWTYGVFCGALLHDVGKPIADQILTLDNGQNWSPVSRAIRETGAERYRIEFNRERQYHLHTQVAMTMFPIIIPTEGRNWLAQDSRLLAQLTAWLYGDNFKAGVLGEIVVS